MATIEERLARIEKKVFGLDDEQRKLIRKNSRGV